MSGPAPDPPARGGRALVHDRRVTSPAEVLDRVHREEWGRIVATLVRLLGSLDRAEEAAQEAFAVALEAWAAEVPAQPRAWLIATARHKGLDRLRRARREVEHDEHVGPSVPPPDERGLELADDRLRLLFTCCHPILPEDAQVALTLRTLCGLTSEEIARAFLVPVTTMQQRIVRAKRALADAKVPYEVPERSELDDRVPAVLTTLYLVFNEGHSASRGEALVRHDLCEEAISLARALAEGLPDQAGAIGLLGLMLLTHARRDARLDAAGEIVTLDEQDRSRWDRTMIEEGRALVRRALRTTPLTRYALQGAVAAVHADAARAEDTDWAEIAALYGLQLRLSPSPVVELNAAVAHALAHDVAEGLRRVLALEGELAGYSPFHAARADLLRRLGRLDEAAEAYRRAAELAGTEPERRFLSRRAGG